MKNKIIGFGLKLSMFFLSWGVVLLSLEMILRVTHYQKKTVVWMHALRKDNYTNILDQKTIFSKVKKGEYGPDDTETDENGFISGHSFDLAQDKSLANAKKIIMLGDSVTHGVGSDNKMAYPLLTEQELRGEGKNVVVYNAAVPGFSLDQEYVRFKDEILPIMKPDLVVWNVNENDINDSNYACLFGPKNDGKYRQISGMQNILFWEGVLIRKTPDFVSQSNLLNVFLASMKHIFTGSEYEDRYTFGCTRRNFDGVAHDGVYKKVNYLLGEMDDLSKKNNFKVLLTLVPFQQYFINDLNSNAMENDFFKLRNTLIQNKYFDFVDFNSGAASIVSSSLVEKREGKNYVASVGQKDNNVLGVSSDKSNMADKMFLSESQEGSSPYGFRHPNQSMYNILPFLIKDEIEKLLK